MTATNLLPEDYDARGADYGKFREYLLAKPQ